MPKKTKKQEKFYLINIRELLDINLNMSLREMQRKLEERGIHLTIGYINKLRGRTLRQMTDEIEQEISEATKTLKRTAAEIIQPFNSRQDTIGQNQAWYKLNFNA